MSRTPSDGPLSGDILAKSGGATVRTATPDTDLGDWNTAARWATLPAPPSQAADRASHMADDPPENVELLEILGAIAEDVSRHCAAVCEGITAEFTARSEHARKTLPRHQTAAAVQALGRMRNAALQLAREMAQAERKARQDNARILYRRLYRPSKDRRDPSGDGSPGR